MYVNKWPEWYGLGEGLNKQLPQKFRSDLNFVVETEYSAQCLAQQQHIELVHVAKRKWQVVWRTWLYTSALREWWQHSNKKKTLAWLTNVIEFLFFNQATTTINISDKQRKKWYKNQQFPQLLIHWCLWDSWWGNSQDKNYKFTSVYTESKFLPSSVNSQMEVECITP